MLRSIQQRDLDRNRWVKITMSVLLGIICLSMLTYLIPGMGSAAFSNSPDAIATVGGEQISPIDVQRQLNQVLHGQAIPEIYKGIYAKQVLEQMIFTRALALEADRLGIRVTNQELSDRIKQILPSAWNGDTWLKDRYATEVQTRAGMTVPEFETYLRDQMLQEKFHELVTDAITVTPAEVQQEFRRRNEKVQIDYVLIKPEELASYDSADGCRAIGLLHQTHRPVPGSRKAFGALRACWISPNFARAPKSATMLCTPTTTRTSMNTRSRTAFMPSTFCSRPSARRTLKSPKSARRPRTF